jgi:cell division protein ZapA
MSELIPLNIVIADRSYRIKALATDEEVIRKTVKLINDKIVEFKTMFSGKDTQDYIAMVIIWHATQVLSESSSNLMAEAEIMEGLKKLDDVLNKVVFNQS